MGQGDVAVAVALAGADVQEHALRIDVADLQVEGFAQAQAAGVDGGQGDAMIQGGDAGQDAAHLGGGEDDGQLELGGGAGQFDLGGPGAVEGFLPEELDGADGLGGSLAGEAPFGLEMDEVLAQFLGGDQVGRAVEVLGQLADAGEVSSAGCGAGGAGAEVVGEAI